MKTKKTKVTRTDITFRCQYSADDIRKALGLPDDASIHLCVPGGGDWSGCRLTIGQEIDFLESTSGSTVWTVEEE